MSELVQDGAIEAVRAASRKLVRSWGFLNDTLADSDLSASAVHTLIELGRPAPLTASDLCSALSLEKSSVSRMLKKLAAAGLLTTRTNGADARMKPLRLTAKGRRVLSAIDRFAIEQVRTALGRLPHEEHKRLAITLSRYADALTDAVVPGAPEPVQIVTGYRPGIVGRCLEMQARYYAEHAEFGQAFETGRANDIADFFHRGPPSRSQFWSALRGDSVIGTVAIDSEGLDDIGAQNAAQLRWFVTDPGARGSGIGRKLLHGALGFCDALGFDETHLWTFAGLNAARHLYEATGFVLVDESVTTEWGPSVLKQHFVRPRGGEGK